MGIPFSQGIQFVYDTQQRFVRAGLEAFLRVSNFTAQEAGDSIEVGVSVTITGAGSNDTGFTDILIDPPPSVQSPPPSRDIGMAGVRVQFNPNRTFLVSNTFVQDQLRLDSFVQASVTDPVEVFRKRDGKRALGIFYLGRLHSIESVLPREVSGEVIQWKVVTTSVNVPSPEGGQE